MEIIGTENSSQDGYDPAGFVPEKMVNDLVYLRLVRQLSPECPFDRLPQYTILVIASIIVSRRNAGRVTGFLSRVLKYC